MKTTTLSTISSIASHHRHGSQLAPLACLAALAWAVTGPAIAANPSSGISFSEIGRRATADYQGDALAVTPMPEEAWLKCAFQKLQGRATAEGLWLESTEPGGGRLRLTATRVSRGDSVTLNAPPPTVLSATGSISVKDKLVRFARPGLAEEYSASVDGVQQDFVITEFPAGKADLRLELALTGAHAEAAAYGARLVLNESARALAYSRLRVTDARGQELTARLEVLSANRLAVRVADGNATYPLRIDPTFSDADWVSLNPSTPGANGNIETVAVDGSGNLYVGGLFTFIGTVSANRVAKWNGSAWSALGSGLNSEVFALAVTGTDLYAGGKFTVAGGVPANRIARWNGSAWLPLGSGMNGWVRALAASGTTLYAGGTFTTAGDVPANRIAQWDGRTWSPLGSGVNAWVRALAVSATRLYAGGTFTTAGDVPANRIAQWDGRTWSPLGSGMNGWVRALAVSATRLYAGGTFTTAGDLPANRIAQWDGNAWSPLGSGMDGLVAALAASRTDLFAGGTFTTAGDLPANRIARWDGTTWSALGSGTSGAVYGLAADGAGHLFVGGNFSLAGTNLSPFIAQANVGGASPGIVVQGLPLANGALTLNCLGVAGATYDVQRATDIHFTRNLTTLCTTNAPSPDGLFRYTDSNPPGPSVFYRLRQR